MSMLPAYVVPAIHIYHMAAFPCSVADIVHHLVFAGFICPVGLILETGPLQNCVGFFICGLPGGIDYLMLACVKHKWMDRLSEKFWNARINVWLRSPGLAFCAFAIWDSSGGDHGLNKGILAISALMCIVNGQYYMQVVVGNTFLRSREEAAGTANQLRAYNS